MKHIENNGLLNDTRAGKRSRVVSIMTSEVVASALQVVSPDVVALVRSKLRTRILVTLRSERVVGAGRTVVVASFPTVVTRNVYATCGRQC
jgi:hypothetical protein